MWRISEACSLKKMCLSVQTNLSHVLNNIFVTGDRTGKRTSLAISLCRVLCFSGRFSNANTSPQSINSSGVSTFIWINLRLN